MLARLHYVDVEGDAVAPSVRIANSSWAVAGADSNPAGWFVPALGFDPKQATVSDGVPAISGAGWLQR
jgi:subtilisin family serine protease